MMWKWLLDPIHGYSFKGIYCFITNYDALVDRNLIDDACHKYIPSKVSVFAWRLLHTKLPTKDNLAHKRVLPSNDTACVVGCDVQETANHLFLGCGLSNTVCSHVWNWLGILADAPCVHRDHYAQFSTMAGMPQFSHSFLQVVWLVCVWVLWKEMNNRVFITP